MKALSTGALLERLHLPIEQQNGDVRWLVEDRFAAADDLAELKNLLHEFVDALAYEDSSCCWGCGQPELYKARKRASHLTNAEFEAATENYVWKHEEGCLMERARAAIL